MTLRVLAPLLQLKLDVVVEAEQLRPAVVTGMAPGDPVTIPQVID